MDQDSEGERYWMGSKRLRGGDGKRPQTLFSFLSLSLSGSANVFGRMSVAATGEDAEINVFFPVLSKVIIVLYTLLNSKFCTSDLSTIF
jgi:hypothetical protein